MNFSVSMRFFRLKRVLFLLPAFILCLCIYGCFDGIYFTRAKFSKTEDNLGNITIGKVYNSREKDFGKDEPALMGKRLYLQKGKTITGEVETTVKQALSQSGYSVVEEGSPTLEVYITRFWCYGLVVYKVEGTVEIRLLAADKETVLYQEEMDCITLFHSNLGYMFEAFDKVMNRIGKDIAEAVKSDKFRTAYKKVGKI